MSYLTDMTSVLVLSRTTCPYKPLDYIAVAYYIVDIPTKCALELLHIYYMVLYYIILCCV